MPDRETVIKAIEICYTVGHNCTECPLFNEDDCNDVLMRDALALLREQEPVEPKWHELGAYSSWQCGNCDEGINYESYEFCPYCGRKVKWNETRYR